MLVGVSANIRLREGKTMPASKAQQKAVSKYMKENYDMYQIRMPKGKKDAIRAHAEARGESVNAFINRAVDETMERDSEVNKRSTTMQNDA